MSFFTSLLSSSKKEEKKASDGKENKEPDTPQFDDEDEGEPPLYISDFLAELVAKERLSDCVFIVGRAKQRIPAHRQILAAASPIFEAMLYPNYDIMAGEKRTVTIPVEITVSGCEPTGFLRLLKAVYSDKVVVDSTSIHDCITLAKKYQIEKLQQICAEYMESDVNIDNACELYELAPSLLDDKDFGLKFIEEHAEEVFETESFLKLSPSRLQSLLESNELSVDEFALYKAVLRWGAAEAKRKGVADDVDHVREICAPLFPLIRFPVMAIEEIAAQVAPSGYLTQDQLLELFRWVSLTDEKERASVPCSFPTALRGGSSLVKESVIFKDKKWKKEILRLFGIGVGVGLKADKPKPKLSLLYRGSRDGFSAGSFHSRCDGKGSAFVVLRAVGQPNIFGAFTNEGFRAASGTYGSTRCWLFSMGGRTGKTIRLESSSTSNNIYHQSSYGPTFGSGHDLHVSSSMKSTSNTCSPSSYRVVSPGFDTITVDNTTLAGQSSWTVDDIEVFSVTGYSF